MAPGSTMRGRVIECHESESNANTRRRVFRGLPRSFWRIAATCQWAPTRETNAEVRSGMAGGGLQQTK